MRRPLPWAAAGLVAVAFDVRTERLDLLPDPIGWALVAMAAGALSCTAASNLAWVAAVVSVATVTLPSHFRYIDPVTAEPVPDSVGRAEGYGEALFFDDVSGWRLGLMLAAAVVAAIALWAFVRALGSRARREDPVAARRLRWAAAVVPAVWLGPRAATSGWTLARGESFDAVWNGGLAYVGLAGVAAVAALAITLVASSGRGWALPAPATASRILGK